MQAATDDMERMELDDKLPHYICLNCGSDDHEDVMCKKRLVDMEQRARAMKRYLGSCLGEASPDPPEDTPTPQRPERENNPPATPTPPPAPAPSKPAAGCKINWERGVPGDETPEYLHKVINVMFEISRPACDDAMCLILDIEPGKALPDREIADKLQAQWVIVMTGGETWEDQPFNMETARNEGMVVDETKKYEFIDMEVLCAQMQGRPAPAGKTLHRPATLPEFFKVVKEGKRLNLLDCTYAVLPWPRQLRPFFSHTLAHLTIITGDAWESIERTDHREEGWGLITSAGCFTEIHHDAGGRYTLIMQFKGRKFWWYLRPNKNTVQRLKTNPLPVLNEMKMYEKPEVMRALGDWFYIPVSAGIQVLQPNWWKHAVWTAEDSFTGGKLFDMGDWDRVEFCLLEEHRAGLTSTNAERVGWYSNGLNHASILPEDPPEEAISTDRLQALRRMVLNPCAHAPQRPTLEEGEYLQIGLYVAAKEHAHYERLLREGKSE
ncbi:hypothetical protein CALVIDRAFT_603633, partial [Calocera viscosa TUFC12733]